MPALATAAVVEETKAEEPEVARAATPEAAVEETAADDKAEEEDHPVAVDAEKSIHGDDDVAAAVEA